MFVLEFPSNASLHTGLGLCVTEPAGQRIVMAITCRPAQYVKQQRVHGISVTNARHLGQFSLLDGCPRHLYKILVEVDQARLDRSKVKRATQLGSSARTVWEAVRSALQRSVRYARLEDDLVLPTRESTLSQASSPGTRKVSNKFTEVASTRYDIFMVSGHTQL